MNSTRRPWSRKYSATAVATNAAFRRTSAGASLVAQTTTERARPAAPSASSRNSTTSRPRSPTSAITFTSASVCRAICPISVDLPTPEPAKSPRRCPSPDGQQRVEGADAERQRARDPATRQRLGGRAIDGPGGGVQDRAAAVDRMTEPVEHASEQRLRGGDRERSPGGRHQRRRGRCRPPRRAASAPPRRRGTPPPRRPADRRSRPARRRGGRGPGPGSPARSPR